MIAAFVVIMMLLAVGLAGFALYLAFKKRDAAHDPDVPEPKKGYEPPKTHAGEPLQHIRCSGISVMYTELREPKEIGTQVEVNMESKQVGIYVLKNIEPTATDWSWYDFEFLRYKHPAASQEDRPVYPNREVK